MGISRNPQNKNVEFKTQILHSYDVRNVESEIGLTVSKKVGETQYKSNVGCRNGKKRENFNYWLQKCDAKLRTRLQYDEYVF